MLPNSDLYFHSCLSVALLQFFFVRFRHSQPETTHLFYCLSPLSVADFFCCHNEWPSNLVSISTTRNILSPFQTLRMLVLKLPSGTVCLLMCPPVWTTTHTAVVIECTLSRSCRFFLSEPVLLTISL